VFVSTQICFKICPCCRSSSYHWSADTDMRGEPFCMDDYNYRFGFGYI
jgi:hypothetical protein